ncbi:MAG: sensor histidine kinase [Clostridiaceae bacterium]
MLDILNYISVTIYGVLIMLFLCNIKRSYKNIVVVIVFTFLISFEQLMVYINFDMEMCHKIYPFTVHFPLLVLFIFFYKIPILDSVFALMTAYVLTTPRKLIGDLVGMAFNGNQVIGVVTQMIVSIPLLILVYIFLKPNVRIMFSKFRRESRFLVILPIFYYLSSYIATVFTDIIYWRDMNVIGIIATGTAILFYYFLIIYFREITEKLNLQYEQNILKIQVEAIKEQIVNLRQNEFETVTYRHDMRHHFLVILSMLCDGNISEAEIYTKSMSDLFVGSNQTYYTENVVTNAVLGAYIEKAKKRKLDISCKAVMPKYLHIDEIEFCVILSNLLENAVQNASDRLDVSIIQNKGQLCVNIENNYKGKIQKDKNGEYLSTKPNGSGIGLKSVKTVVDKRKGVMEISDDNNIFKVQVAINNY